MKLSHFMTAAMLSVGLFVGGSQLASAADISHTEAVRIFHSRYPDATVQSVSYERENGRMVYEVEGYTMTREIDMEIDAATGKVLKVETDHRD